MCCLRLLLLHAELVGLAASELAFSSGSSTCAAGNVDDDLWPVAYNICAICQMAATQKIDWEMHHIPQKLFNSLANVKVPAAGLCWHQKLTRQKFNMSNHTPASPSQTTLSLVLELHHYSYILSALLLAIRLLAIRSVPQPPLLSAPTAAASAAHGSC